MEEEKFNPIVNFGDKLTQGRNLNTFSSDNQPATKGRKKTRHISRLMKAMSKSVVPKSIITGDIQEFLEANGWKGTYYEACIARLYLIALAGKDSVAIKAIKQILDLQNGKRGDEKSGVVIQFIAPPKEEEQEAPIDLTNDSWSLQVPGESKTD